MEPRRKLIITGANGFVGGSILAQAGEEWEVHALSRGPASTRRNNLHWHSCDPLATNELTAIFRNVRPFAAIHTAAIADIDFCQARQDLARAVNVDLTRNVAALCAETGARMVFCSTDTIFDGEHAPYKEEDAPDPVNFYAQTKVEAEQAVAVPGARAVTARLALVIGLPLLGSARSFLARMIEALKEGRTVGTSAEEVRTPIDVITTGKALLELAAGEHHGIFHLAGLSRVSRFEMNQMIAARFGFPKHLMLAQPANTTPGRAQRPRDVSLVNEKVRAALKTPMRTLDEGLSLILKGSAVPSGLRDRGPIDTQP